MNSSNYSFLKPRKEQLVTPGTLARSCFPGDRSRSIIKPRQFAELMVKLISAYHADYLINERARHLRA